MSTVVASDSSSGSSDDLLVLAAIYEANKEIRRKRKREYWVHNIFRARLEEGEFHTLFKRLQDDERKFCQYYRMTPQKFNHLLDLLQAPLGKLDTKFRKSVSPCERLTVFLR